MSRPIRIYRVVWSPYEMQYYRDDWTQPFLNVTPTYTPLPENNLPLTFHSSFS